MKDPTTYAKQIIEVVAHDPTVDVHDPVSMENAAIDLAEELCLYSETEKEIKRRLSTAAFVEDSSTRQLQRLL